MAHFQILFNHNGTVCLCDKMANGCCWCFTSTEEQAKQRIADLAGIGIQAWYEPIDENHPINTDEYKG